MTLTDPSRSRPAGTMTSDEIAAFFTELARIQPEPRGELDHVNPFTLLVAVVLSAQATDVSVNKATAPVFAHVRTPEAMLAFGEERLREAIRTIGLYRTKAKNVIALCRLLIDRHGGEVPQDRDLLETLPGVGRKTANVVMNMAFGAHTIAVDTHVFRVANRTGMAPGRTPQAVEAGLEAVVPDRFRQHAHHWLILHGRYVCTARAPRCGACTVRPWCHWPDKTALPGTGAPLKRPDSPRPDGASAPGHELPPDSLPPRAKAVRSPRTPPPAGRPGKRQGTA